MLYLNKEVIWRVVMRYVKFWAMIVDLYIYLLTICIGFDLVLGVRKFTETFEIFGKSQLIVWFILILINDLMLGNRSIGKHMMEIEVVDEVKEHKKIKRGILSIFSSRKKEKS